MTHELAQVPVDQPLTNPAPATSEQDGEAPTPVGRRRGVGRPSPLLGWLLVSIAALGMFISTPPSAGPDEPAQLTTAWFLTGHGLRIGPIESFTIPASFASDPCFKGAPDITASCAPSRSSALVTTSSSRVLTYAPPYYLVVGFGARLAAALVGNEYADVGGRVASMILNFGALLLLSLYMRRRNYLWGTLLLLDSTPMAVFMGSVVNPSSWEITCGLVMAAILSEAVWSRRSLASGDWSRTTASILVIACVALCLTRPIGWIWAIGLTVSALALAPSVNRRLVVRIACAVAPGLAMAMLWSYICPSSTPGAETGAGASPQTVANLVSWFGQSLTFFPIRVYQMFGILGWQDTPAPLILFLLNLEVWIALLLRLPSIRRAAVLCGVLWIVVLPSVIETGGWALATANWWQGRYTLPFALGFTLLLVLRSGQLVPRAISVASGFSALSLGVMVWVNAIRYDFGVNFWGVPLSLAHQGISPVRLFLSVAVGVSLLLACAYLLVQAWRMTPDPPRKPKMPSAAPSAKRQALGLRWLRPHPRST